MAVIVDGQQQHIGLLAGLNRANALRALDGRRGIDGGGGNRLGGGQFEGAAGQRDDELHALAPGGAGVAVRGQCQQSAGIQNLPGRGVMRIGQPEGGAGQRHGDGITRRQRGDIRRGCLHQVVGGCRPQFSRQAGAAQVVKLIRVNFERESPGRGQSSK